MYSQIFGEKNSVKRAMMNFCVFLVLIALVFGSMVVVQSHIAAEQYDELLQNIVSIESSKKLLEQVQLSVKKYAQARSEQDYAEFEKNRDALEDRLQVIRDISRDPSSSMAVDRAQHLLVKADAQVLRIRSGEGEYDELVLADEWYNNVLYLLNRVQNLEVNCAADIYPQLSQNMKTLTKLAGAVLVLMLLAAAAFSADFHARIYAPIRQLVTGVGEISKGNFQAPDIEVSTGDEFHYLATAVNGMKRDLSHMITTREEKLNAERLLKEAQFLALQSQVNPHFLFNVLGAATAMALQEGADKTLDIVESISYMLRYSLQAAKTNVSLRDEIKMVQTYLFLQNQRFGDRIAFSVEVQEPLPEVSVPGMTVQPIVENAVVHGCEKLRSGGWLKVRCGVDAQARCAVVTVENNGGVLSPEQISAFRAGVSIPHSEKTTGIGLLNVRDRMQFFYDREDLMDCETVDGRSSIVTLRYPMDEETV